MPKEIEDYVHQIGRTGRSGKTGIATTFVNMNTTEQTLLDLKYLLKEAKQRCVFSILCFLSLAPVDGNRLYNLFGGFAGSRPSSLVWRIPTQATEARDVPSVVVWDTERTTVPSWRMRSGGRLPTASAMEEEVSEEKDGR